jgi:hypothetical protein
LIVIPAKREAREPESNCGWEESWIPAFAGMTKAG